jgi:glycolate oxidase iron-sulfur subunit
MQTNLSPEFAQTPEGEEASGILRKCVHCGFCNATCPTYQLLGDELDGPRGRIYLIKQVLEGAPVTRTTQLHLDRCLTCLNCETTCPSGVKYGDLVDIGRKIVDERVERPAGEKTVRWILKEGMTSPLFAPAMSMGKALRPLLPQLLRDKVPATTPTQATPRKPLTRHRRKILMLRGCVQPAMLPNIDRAAARVLDTAGIEVINAAGTGCCGALRTHLSDQAGGLDNMRRNIDAWMPVLDSIEVEAVVSSASACQLAIKDYARALAHDAVYAARAARISALARDLSELLPDLVDALKDRCKPAKSRAVFHAPCTLQHGQKLRGGVEAHMRALGFDVTPPAAEAHLCCGSAGTYSVLQPELARQLRDRKLKNIAATEAQCILSANVGCIQHLQSGTAIPVKHWIEMLDEALI